MQITKQNQKYSNLYINTYKMFVALLRARV